jgi:predicted RNA binding protein YcfA (HicA-like mRNA interferase family)
MSSIDKVLLQMAIAPQGVRFSDLMKVCRRYFGEPRIKGSHHVFKAPGAKPPIVDVQPRGAMAKLYQVRQVLAAVRDAGEGSQQ